MKKLLPLIHLAALVGCAETITSDMDYADRETCVLNEMYRYSNPSNAVVGEIYDYCKRYKPKDLP